MPGRWAFNTIVLPAVTSSNLCPPSYRRERGDTARRGAWWSVKSNLQTGKSRLLFQDNQRNSPSQNCDSPSPPAMLTLVGWWWGDGDLVRFLIITSSCWFCRLRFIISVAPAKITRSNKRAATTGKRRNILKIFSLPKQGVRIGVLINSHVSSNHSVLGTNSMLMIAAALAPSIVLEK